MPKEGSTEGGGRGLERSEIAILKVSTTQDLPNMNRGPSQVGYVWCHVGPSSDITSEFLPLYSDQAAIPLYEKCIRWS